MLKSFPLILTYLFLLSVHGQEVVAKVRFLSETYIKYEGPSGMFCITIINDEPSQANFRVSYTFTTSLLGSPVAGTRPGALNFAAGASASSLCIPNRDDLVACEPDIVGTVTLVNSTSVHIGQPSTATVILKDNDPLNLSFQTAALSYSENSGSVGNPPVISVINDHTQLANPVEFMVEQTRRMENLVDRSLTIQNSRFTLSNTVTSHAIGLTISSDQTALESNEIVILSVVPVIPSKCFAVNVAPINTTQITVIDTNDVVVGLKDTQLSVKEDARRVEVCVTASASLARALPFTLRTVGTAGVADVDFTDEVFEGRFEPFSNRREICTDFSVVGDGVVELSESFDVVLSINEDILRTFGDRIQITNVATTITIVDTSRCTSVILDSSSNGTLYLPPSTSICFSCRAGPNSVGAAESWTWTINNNQLNGEFSNGEVYSNGTLLIVNSSKLFSPTVPQLTITCSSAPTLTRHSTNAVLGAPPRVFALTHNFIRMEAQLEMMLTCVFGGSPQPSVTWWLGERRIPDPADQGRLSKKVTVDSSASQSVLHVRELSGEDIGQYVCVAVNQFGESSADSYLTQQQLDFYTMPSSSSHSAALSLHQPVYSTLLLTLCALIMSKL